jgi:hypothetical protein
MERKMIGVTELISGQSFESMKLASEYFNIPIRIITTTLKSNAYTNYKNKKFKFVHRTSKKEGTTVAGPMIHFPYGKLKDQRIESCTDIQYLNELTETDIQGRYLLAVRRRLRELTTKK